MSALEVLVGAAIVVAHNVYRALPKEVLIVPILAIVSIRLREGRFAGRVSASGGRTHGRVASRSPSPPRQCA